MSARFHVDLPLRPADVLSLPPAAARHAQVVRLQPGSALVLFDGRGGEWDAEVVAMGRHNVDVRIGTHHDVNRELRVAVTLAIGMPANERMDALIEKACELGVARIQPLMCERSVLRVKDDRAERKVARWRDIAISACEQSGRTVLPVIEPVRSLNDFLSTLPETATGLRCVLSPRATASWSGWLAAHPEAMEVMALSGPEGGLTAQEEQAALARGFVSASLGPRVLRADTAPLAVLACVAAFAEGRAG